MLKISSLKTGFAFWKSKQPLIYFISFCLLGFMSACQFNSVYLKPQKIPAGVRKMTVNNAADTTKIQFDEHTLQPLFLTSDLETMPQKFLVSSYIYQGSEGNKLNGWLMKPLNEAAKITIIHFHGNAGFLVSQYQAISPLIDYGFQVFTFDYSGYGFSEGESTRENVLNDGNATIAFVKSLPEVKNTKLVIYGQSLGGHLAAVVGTGNQSDIDALVIEGAFSSHKDIAANSIPILGRLLVKEMYSAKESIGNFRKPLLIIHSTDDETIPFSHGKKLFDSANQPKEFYEIRNCHICGLDFYAAEIAHKIQNMIK